MAEIEGSQGHCPRWEALSGRAATEQDSALPGRRRLAPTPSRNHSLREHRVFLELRTSLRATEKIEEGMKSPIKASIVLQSTKISAFFVTLQSSSDD
jgi:hypothetical protein